MPRRPNFVLFITDQQRADFLGCYGHPQLRTPNIDTIAAAGVAFDRFYVASPVCMPNRASLMTARMPANHGVRMNGVPLSQRNVTFVELLRDAGYKTALIGNAFTVPAYRGKSAQPRSVKARASLAREAGYERILAETSPDNLASQRGMTKGGMQLLGRMDLLVAISVLVFRWRRPAGFPLIGFCLWAK